MKSIGITLILILTIGLSFGQNTEKENYPDEDFIYVFVTEKRKVILNGEKSSLQKLELHLEKSDKTKAKIGTVKPTPLKVFAEFEKVVELFESHNIETVWYRDQEFSISFFDEEKEE